MVGSTLQLYEQDQYLKSMQKFQRARYEAQKLNTENAAHISQATVNLRLRREQLQAEQAAEEVTGRAQRAFATKLAGSSGGEGQAVNDVYQSFLVSESMNIGTISDNLDASVLQAELDKEGIRAKARTQIMAATPEPVHRPNFYLGLLNAAGDSASTFMTLSSPA